MAEKSIREEIEITQYGSDGLGLGRLADGRVVFVPNTIVGEKALIRYQPTDALFVLGDLVKILQPSEKRIAPHCPHFGVCAGCQLQFLAYADQLEAKRAVLVDQLRRIGEVADPESLLEPTIASEKPFGYRQVMRFQVREDGSLTLPVYAGKKLFIAAECPLCTPAINDLLQKLTFEDESGISDAEFREGLDEDLQLILRSEIDKPETEIELDLPISLVYSSPSGSYVMAGDSTQIQEIAGKTIAVSEDGRYYPNPEVLTAVCKRLEKELPNHDDYNVLNLIAGAGFWAKWIAGKCRKVAAQDWDMQYAEDFALNLEEFDNVALYIGKPEEILPVLKERIKLVIAETGSHGLSDAAVHAVQRSGASQMMYISEDSAILARDVVRFREHGFALQLVLPFDDEPQTAKISAACLFQKIQ